MSVGDVNPYGRRLCPGELRPLRYTLTDIVGATPDPRSSMERTEAQPQALASPILSNLVGFLGAPIVFAAALGSGHPTVQAPRNAPRGTLANACGASWRLSPASIISSSRPTQLKREEMGKQTSSLASSTTNGSLEAGRHLVRTACAATAPRPSSGPALVVLRRSRTPSSTSYFTNVAQGLAAKILDAIVIRRRVA